LGGVTSMESRMNRSTELKLLSPIQLGAIRLSSRA
jgi:hypothetical protein